MNIIEDIRSEIRSAKREPSSRDLNILALLFLVIGAAMGGYQLFWKGAPRLVLDRCRSCSVPFEADSAVIQVDLQLLAGIFCHSGLFCIQNSVDDHFFHCNNTDGTDLSRHREGSHGKKAGSQGGFLLEPKGAGSGHNHRKIRKAILICNRSTEKRVTSSETWPAGTSALPRAR